MKFVTTLTALALALLGAQLAAHAQTSGNPFLFTAVGSNVADDPAANYTASGSPATAFVPIGGLGTFTCQNTDTRVRLAATAYIIDVFAHIIGGAGANLCAATTRGYWTGDMMPNETLTYSNTAFGAGNIGVGSYYAAVDLYIEDEKTTDYMNVALDPFDFSVS